MNCAECERLTGLRERRKRLYELANLNLNAVAPGAEQGQFMVLKTLAEEAERDLELVNTEIMQHRKTHTLVPGR